MDQYVFEDRVSILLISRLSKSRSTVECFPSTFEGLGACQIFPSMTFAYQVSKTFTITKLTKHKGKQLIPATEPVPPLWSRI